MVQNEMNAPLAQQRQIVLVEVMGDVESAAAAEPGFLGGVLAYIAANEHTLLAFAAKAGIAPEEVEKARAALGDAGWEREVP